MYTRDPRRSNGTVIQIRAAGAIPEHRFVAPNRQLCGAGGYAIGVTGTRGAATAGELADLVIDGVWYVEAGAAIAAGAVVASDANGRAVPHTSGTKIGVALAAADAPVGTSYQLVPVLRTPGLP
ncbi:MAG: DUF2190 family protein [Thermomicrobium sp.]|nr:DUF2190 family protein [Thermomicrobium sp.]